MQDCVTPRTRCSLAMTVLLSGILGFKKCHNLPALLFWQLRPTRHSLIQVPVGDKPDTSLAFAFFTEGFSNVGAGPIPCKLLPWHWEQFWHIQLLAPTAACASPEYGFFNWAADAGAFRKVELWP